MSDIDEDVDSCNYRCNLCCELKTDDTLSSIIVRANDPRIHKTPIKSDYLTISQLNARSLHHAGRFKEHVFTAFNSQKNLTSLMKHRDELKALIIAISENKVARGQQLLALELKRGHSITHRTEMYLKAAHGKYRPKQFDDDDLDESYLALALGGERLAYAQNNSDAFGGASSSTIRRKANVPQEYLTLSSEIDAKIICSNMERFLFSAGCTSDVDSAPCLWNLQVDDIKGEKRLRIDERDGKVRGLCYHAVENNISLDIKCPGDCDTICNAFDEGKVHYSQELTNIAFAPIREKSYEPRVVATSAGCREGDPQERLYLAMSIAIGLYVKHEKGQKLRGTLSTVQPDGATSFVKIGHCLFFSKKMKDDHPLFSILSKLPLFCLWTGTGDFARVTMGCEMKHSGKRVRERIKSNIGCTFVQFEFTGRLLRDLLIASGSHRSEVDAMFAAGYADAMNVPYMVKLFRALASLKDKEPGEFGVWKVTVMSCSKDLCLLSEFAGLLAELVADKQPSLGKQMANISDLMHCSFVIFRRNGTKWLVAQTYDNFQRML